MTSATANMCNLKWRAAVFALSMLALGVELRAQAPVLSFLTPLNMPGATVGVPYSLAYAATGGSPPYSFAQANRFNPPPPGLTLATGGLLRGTPTVAGDYTIGIRVNDSRGGGEIDNFMLEIARDLRITTDSRLPPGAVSEPFNLTLGAIGGRPGYSWMIVDGELPAGLSFSSGGVLSGTPSVPGTFSFTATVHDSFEVSASAVFNLVIDEPLQITSDSPLPPGVLGAPYSTTLIAGGGQPLVLWDVVGGGLPSGLALNRPTGEISGTPTAPGPFNFTVRATDALEEMDSKAFTLEIFDQLTITSPAVLPIARPGEPYWTQLMAVGGTQPFLWSVQRGELPAGLELFQTGAIEGTPEAAGVFRFIARVIDAEQLSATKALRLGVSRDTGLSIGPPPPLPAGVVGEIYRVSLTAEGGEPPYNWAVVGGALPLGLRLGDDGVINGVPLQPGVFKWTALLTDSMGGKAVAGYQIRVDRTVDDAGEISLLLPPLNFSFSAGATTPRTRGFVVKNGGGVSANLSIGASTQDGSNWLSVSARSGTSTAATPLSVVVRANPGGLLPGAYFGQIAVEGALLQASRQVLPVGMTISRRRQFQQLLPRGLTFTAVHGGGVAPELKFYIQNKGVEPMDWTASVFQRGPDAGGGLPVGSGVVQPGEGEPVLISLAPGDLPPGVHRTLIQVEAPGAAGQFRLLPVTLNLLPAGSVPDPIVNPAGLLFAASSGEPPPRRVRITNLASADSEPLTVAIRLLNSAGPEPFSHTPSTATIPGGGGSDVIVAVSPQGLSAGVYESLMILDFSTGFSKTVPLKLVVTPGSTVGLAESDAGHKNQGGCTPTTLVPSIDSFWGGFPSYGGAPGEMAVNVVDDCGAPLEAGGDVDVVATFVGTGDAPLALNHMGAGVWEDTVVLNWTGPVVINITARDGDRGLIGQETFEAMLNEPLSDAPAIAPGGIVHAANFASQPLAPGGLVSIFGTNLAETGVPSQATSIPLPEVLAEASIEAGADFILFPLLSAAPSQINAQLPSEFSADAGPLDVLVTRLSATSAVPYELQLTDARPGIFTIGSTGVGDAVVQDASFRLVSGSLPPEQNPGGRQSVAAGEPVIIYATGLGAVSPAVPSGTAAGADPLSTVADAITLEIGGQTATVFFAGLSPGFVGLYQINAFVPQGLTSGDAAVVITASGIASSDGVTLTIE